MRNQLPLKLSRVISSHNFDTESKERISKAYSFAAQKHSGQKRKSGSPYILHPLRVAINLATDTQNAPLIIAGLLHDTIEDTETTLHEIGRLFGQEVADLVSGVTKVSAIKLKDKAKIFSDSELYLEQVDNYRKLLIATAQDPRIIVIKLYDRLDNAATIQWLPPAKREFYARETIEIFAPIAERLGMGYLKGNLEDYAFPYAYPEKFREFSKTTKGLYQAPRKALEGISPIIEENLRSANIPIHSLDRRTKFRYSLFKKLERKGSLSQIHDLLALRVITNSVENCYKALGVLHSVLEPLPGQIDDYIAKPKESGYQSLHTTVKDTSGNVFEIQIKTDEMHDFAEHGVAAHWHYKESGGKQKRKTDNFSSEWLAELSKISKVKDDGEFLEELKGEVFSDKVFVFTPKGDIIKLPAGSTPIDFAYRIHTQLGHRLVGAKINGRIMPIGTKLVNADTVEVTSAKTARPSKDWLALAKTKQARNKIKGALREELDAVMTEIGEKKFYDTIKKHALLPIDKERLEKLFSKSRLPHKTLGRAFRSVGSNTLPVYKLIKLFYPNFSPSEEKFVKQSPSGASTRIMELEGIRHDLAKCCKPKPGEQIVGYTCKEHLIRVHRVQCKRLRDVDQRRLSELSWENL
ncbi:MAG TPA: RelA/SpoT family protein [bacterium]|nr:RelA/SpoT family protein [bacterium]